MSLKIELFKNRIHVILGEPLNIGQTVVTLTAGHGALLPDIDDSRKFYPLTLENDPTSGIHEIVYVTAKTGDEITILRGQEDTAEIYWSMGSKAAFLVTAETFYRLASIYKLQRNWFNSATDTGAANDVVLTVDPPITDLAAHTWVTFEAAADNTGETTLTLDGVEYPLYGLADMPLQGGELVTGGEAYAVFVGDHWVLAHCSGGSLQIADATDTQHAITLKGAKKIRNHILYAIRRTY